MTQVQGRQRCKRKTWDPHPETLQRRARAKAERTQALRKAARERAREAATSKPLTEMTLLELGAEWNYVWDDLQAYKRRPKNVGWSPQWEETKRWLARRLKRIEALIKYAERAS